MVFAAFIGFIVAGFSLVGLADDSPMIPLMKTNLALAAAWTTIQVGAVVALLAVVIGGMPLALTVFRRALAGDRRGLGLLLVPVFSSWLWCSILDLFSWWGRAGSRSRASSRWCSRAIFRPGTA